MTGKSNRFRRGRAAYGIPAGAGGRWRMPPEPAANSPRAICRLSILQHTGGQGLRHDLSRIEFADYLVGEGKGSDGKLPSMFPPTDDVPKDFKTKWMLRDKSVDVEQIGFDGKRWPLQQAWCVDVMRRPLVDEPRHFRLMVAPEPKAGTQLSPDDMRDFGRELMNRVSDDIGRQILWVGAAHFNTDEPHLHFGIRGMDELAEPVYFHQRYIKRGFEWRARELLAETVGSRKEVRRAG